MDAPRCIVCGSKHWSRQPFVSRRGFPRETSIEKATFHHAASILQTMEKIEDDPVARATRAAMHATGLKAKEPIDLHDSRIELVRRYLGNPNQWPDGLDWPNWKEPHDLWYTGHEAYWHPLAKALQAKLDNAKDVLRQA